MTSSTEIDEQGYLIYHEDSTVLRKITAKILRELDLHVNGQGQYYSDDIIFGVSGSGRWLEVSHPSFHHDELGPFSALSLFLIYRGILRVEIARNDNGEMKVWLAYKEQNIPEFRRDIKRSFTTSKFEKWCEKRHRTDSELLLIDNAFYPIYEKEKYIFMEEVPDSEFVSVNSRIGLISPDML